VGVSGGVSIVQIVEPLYVTMLPYVYMLLYVPYVTIFLYVISDGRQPVNHGRLPENHGK
jgi:hypothetical protein